MKNRMSKLLKKLLKSLIDTYGFETVLDHVNHLKDGEVTTQGEKCPVGYYWNATVGACVIDAGTNP
jgi:hypothetical protein